MTIFYGVGVCGARVRIFEDFKSRDNQCYFGINGETLVTRTKPQQCNTQVVNIVIMHDTTIF